MALDNNTALTFVENNSVIVTSPPNVTIISVDTNKISSQTGKNQCHVVFKFDDNVTQWTVNVMGASWDTGTIADSGGIVTAGTEITAIIDNTELYQEGYNKVNIYGQNNIGWTVYEEDPNTPIAYYLSTNGISDYIQTPSLTCTKIEIDFSVESDIEGDSYIDTVQGVGGWWREPSSQDDQYDGIFNSVAKNNIAQPQNGIAYIGNTRAIYTINVSATNRAFYIMRAVYSDANLYTKGKIYSVKFYNSSTLIAFYDMSTGNIQDKSGNENHGTLVGGTWVVQ